MTFARRLGLVGFCLLVLLAGSAVAARAAGTGVVQGRLVNGTKDGSTVSGQVVTLNTLVNKVNQSSANATTDASGLFSFGGLDTGPEYSYIVNVVYQKADYLSDPAVFAPGETNKSITLSVFDSTSSDSAITVATAHTVIYPSKDSAEVREYFLFDNSGDRTYISGANGETLRFWLPPGATNLKMSYGLDATLIHLTAGGFSDLMGVYPGQTEVAYSYQLKVANGALAYTRKNLYATDRYDFLFTGANVQGSSARLAIDQPLDIGGQTLGRYSATQIAAGENSDIQLTRLPASSAPAPVLSAPTSAPIQAASATGSHILVLFGAGLGVIVIILAVVWFRRKPLPVAASPAGNGIERRQQLLADMADLDDDFEAGKIAEESYKRLRFRMKSELLALAPAPARPRKGGKRARR